MANQRGQLPVLSVRVTPGMAEQLDRLAAEYEFTRSYALMTILCFGLDHADEVFVRQKRRDN